MARVPPNISAEYLLESTIDHLAENIDSRKMKIIALQYLDMTDADIKHCEVDADHEGFKYSFHLSKFILKLWQEQNVGYGIHMKLYKKLEEARKQGLICEAAYQPFLTNLVSLKFSLI